MSPQMLAWPCASRGKPGLNTFGRTEWGPLGLRDAVHAGSAWARPAASGPRPPSARERATRRGWRARCAWRAHTPGRPCSEVRPGPGEWSVVRTHSLESAPMRGLRLAPGGSRSPASETSKTPSTVGVQLDSRTRGRPDAGDAGRGGGRMCATPCPAGWHCGRQGWAPIKGWGPRMSAACREARREAGDSRGSAWGEALGCRGAWVVPL